MSIFCRHKDCCEEVVKLLRRIAETDEAVLAIDKQILAALSQPSNKAVALKFSLGTPINQ